MLVWLALEVAALIALTSTEKLALHARMNCCHSPAMDSFFSLFTHLADGLVPTFLALVLLLSRDWRAFLLMGLGCGLSALCVQGLKHSWFASEDRPSAFAEQLGAMDWVSGVELHRHFSFPSGHSTAAFAMCFALAVLLNRKAGAFALALLAALLAFSRIYLSQHFLRDAAAGSALGLGVALLVWWWLYRSPFSRKAWLSRAPFRRQNQ